MNHEVCGTSEITGARFTIHPMADDFVSIILGAIEETDTSKVWRETDDVSTCVRGRSIHVFDTVKAIFLNASKTGKHVVLNATFSNGCPGDAQGDVYLSENDERMNEASLAGISQDVSVHFALYPLGSTTYMDTIMDQVNDAIEKGVKTQGVHYATRLDGNAHDIFTTLERAFNNCLEGDSSHVVMTVTMSANSPSKKGEK
ncbi:YkoF family thiamine/hydroxymethylpyrimidine-binding protein [Bacillus sp. SCS-153A]|uniref:YkoF family thiamine/hydroxymethylpyrimidine-binding protein n=1 Tax=Rossellomorea sedimentorum TaxID=3115294 RepID=UPI003905F5C2